MSYCRSLLAGLLLTVPASSFAQSPWPRYYAGLGVYSSTFQRLGSRYDRATVPVQAQFGYRWHPRWAVQLGVAYSGSANGFDYQAQYLDPATGNPIGDYSNVGYATAREVSVALLARRTLTRQAAHRVQFDLAGGLTYEGGRYHNEGHYVSTYPGYPVDERYDHRAQVSQLLVGVGPGVRLRATTHLEVLLDVLLNAPLGQQGSTGLRSSTLLGVRYNFGAGS